jgi:hypothetical protein
LNSSPIQLWQKESELAYVVLRYIQAFVYLLRLSYYDRYISYYNRNVVIHVQVVVGGVGLVRRGDVPRAGF